LIRRASKVPEEDEADPFPLTSDQRYYAARVVASAATDAADCALLLAVLGLDPAAGFATGKDEPMPRALP